MRRDRNALYLVKVDINGEERWKGKDGGTFWRFTIINTKQVFSLSSLVTKMEEAKIKIQSSDFDIARV